MTVELDCAGLPRGVRKQGRLHRLHVAQSRCRGVHFDLDIRHFSLSFQVFPNSCFLFSSCINKEYSYGCFSGGRHCRRVESRVCWSGFSTPSSCPMWEHCNSTSIRINATGVAKTMPVTHTGPHLWVSGTT